MAVLPKLIVVTGRPASGKTTLARDLARVLHVPMVSRDEIKEGLLSTLGDAGDDLQRRATDTFFDTLALLLGREVSVVAEAAFQHKVWASRLEALQKLALVMVVVCDVDPQNARARLDLRERSEPDRARFHSAAMARDLIDRYESPNLDVPTLRVDTSDGYRPTLDVIVDFAGAGAR